MNKVFFLIIGILILFFAFPSVYSANLKINEYPNNFDNVLLFTIDDLTLSTEENINLAEKITCLFDSYKIPVTFFAIPKFMEPYNFSENYEIAQHGYDHINPHDGSYKEFRGLSTEEIDRRLQAGKVLLEEKGYAIHGFRAPSLSIGRKMIPHLQDNYLYDSSFIVKSRTSSNFVKTLIPLDTTYMRIDGKGYIHSSFFKIVNNKLILFWIFLKDIQNEPIVLLSHFGGFNLIFEDASSQRYFSELLNELNEKNYWKTTLSEYSQWKINLSSLSYALAENATSINILFSNQLSGLTFEGYTEKKISSNYPLLCSSDGIKQLCIVS